MSEDLEDEYTIKNDFMVKRSVMKSSIFQYDNFKARWFYLTNMNLKYNEGSLEKGVGKEKGKIPLSCIKVVEEANLAVIHENKQFGFQVWYEDTTINPKKHLKLYVSASSEQMRQDWIFHIREACSGRRVEFTTKYHPGVWTPKSGEFTCCGQQSKEAPGCTASTSTSERNNQNSGGGAGNGSTLKKALQPVKNRTRHNSSSPRPDKKQPSPLADRKKQTTTTSPKPIRRATPQQEPAGPQIQPQFPEPGIVNDLVSLSITEPSKPAPAPPISPSGLLQKQYVLVTFDYSSDNPDDLEISKGEKLEVVDNTTEQFWWQARNSEGKIGFVPFNYVTEIKSTAVETHPWFYPDMSRQRAELLLKEDGREGVYLVRKSNNSNCYTVGIFTKESRPDNGTIRHYHIKTNEKGEYFLSDVHPQPSIPEVIGYHSQNSGGLITRLRFHPHEKPAPPTVGFSHGKFRIERSDLKMDKQLGKGNFGEVWKARYKGRIDVAVKMTLPNLVNDYEFVAEAKIMMQLQNEHLVQLYGVCEQPNLLIVTEYMEEGALLDYLKRTKSQLQTQPNTCIDIAKQVCEGMAYLEKSKFIHRDLAARNCLVGSGEYGYTVKVADFGLSRHVVDDEYTCSIGAKFPIRWSSPEVLLLTRFSSKSDVWAFGILMWEVFTGGETPYNDLPRNQDVVEFVSKKGRHLPCPRSCPSLVYENIITKCWQFAEELRPKFSELVDLLSLNWTRNA